ncbi:FKBP-type peptidyl-prolyl cis-trans isomerase [Sphingomonas sp. AOB5]|uniref:FKBP-type peptidyl-prolyl cis-trans isomerase n=1 Tax=Sphingomonas sp. AOB5 TaxID=3034017 RepID=UPI0023F831C0|nr:FKBP-type peptidyl-prolyl cis-trans isomerase [Sphingomonas sp. AOB5]MDF7774922.1 FKBP-type peptidyl-prolyl cis-trans isomerase [Sphingomonas sp. AOB5]
MIKFLPYVLPYAVVAAVIPAAAMVQDAPDATTPQDAAWHNRQQLAISSLKAADGWQPLPGNGRWRRVKGDGTGRHPAVTDTVTLHYAGTLIDGTEFDSSFKRGEPATFPLNRLVKGWQVAVPNMGVGDTIEIAIPADMAYGPNGRGPIPGNATLLFTIQLIAIQ